MTPEPLDSAPSHELTKPIDNRMTAVHGRFLLPLNNPNRELLNPKNTDIPEIKQEDLQSDLSKQNFKLFNEASFNERLKQNGVSADKLDAAVDEWTTDTLEKINAASSFEAFDEETQTRWNTSLAKLVHKSSLTDLTKDDIKKIYDIYCTDGKVSNIDVVIKDIMQNMGGKEELLQNLDCIEWFAGMFGDVSSVMVRELAIAETRLEEPTFISYLNTKNSETQKPRTVEPTEPEENLLQSIYDNTKGEPQKRDEQLDEKKGIETEISKDAHLEVQATVKELVAQDQKDRDVKLTEPSKEFLDLEDKIFETIDQSIATHIDQIPDDQKKLLLNPIESKYQDPYEFFTQYAKLRMFIETLVPHLPDTLGPGFESYIRNSGITLTEFQKMGVDRTTIPTIAQRTTLRRLQGFLINDEIDKIIQGESTQENFDRVQKLFATDPQYQVNRDHVKADIQNIQEKLPIWEEALSKLTLSSTDELQSNSMAKRIEWGTGDIVWIPVKDDARIKFGDDQTFTSPLTNEDIRKIDEIKNMTPELAKDIVNAGLVYFSLPENQRSGNLASIESVQKYLHDQGIHSNDSINTFIESQVPQADRADIWRSKTIAENYKELIATGDKIVMSVGSVEKFSHDMLILGMKNDDFVVWDPWLGEGFNAIRLLSTTDLNKAAGSEKGDHISVAVRIKQTP